LVGACVSKAVFQEQMFLEEIWNEAEQRVKNIRERRKE
jgi:hypothetical protein